MLCPGLVVDHTQRAVVERIDTVGTASDRDVSAVAQIETPRDLLLDLHYGKRIVRHIVRDDAMLDITRRNIMYQNKISTIIRCVRLGHF